MVWVKSCWLSLWAVQKGKARSILHTDVDSGASFPLQACYRFPALVALLFSLVPAWTAAHLTISLSPGKLPCSKL